MKVELHVNGSLQVWLKPETELERAILSEMHESATKGRAIKFDTTVAPGDPVGGSATFVMGVEK